jgi:hypothetical protein
VIQSIATEVNMIGQAGLGISVDGTGEWIVQSSRMMGEEDNTIVGGGASPIQLRSR